MISPGEKLGFAASVVGLGRDDVRRLAHERDPWWLGISADAFVVFGARPDELVAGSRRGRAAA